MAAKFQTASFKSLYQKRSGGEDVRALPTSHGQVRPDLVNSTASGRIDARVPRLGGLLRLPVWDDPD
jgi:hypothetical protein